MLGGSGQTPRWPYSGAQKALVIRGLISSTWLIKHNICLCGGGQVSDKSKTSDNNTFYSKQIFIILLIIRRTERAHAVSSAQFIYTVCSPRLEACCDVSRVLDRSPTRSALQIHEHFTNTQLAVHYKAITTFAQQYSSQYTQYVKLYITTLWRVQKDSLFYTFVRSGIFKGTTTQLPFVYRRHPFYSCLVKGSATCDAPSMYLIWRSYSDNVKAQRASLLSRRAIVFR